ncbi:hypothetical protein [Dehalogenimonas alkenigignens]|uniref:Lipoprotein n=1 Tax=Dehalogenimonas alkenigignens TaxID=1217799 RepID=A0A0W0GGI1_9CHLR|nr:hypothetical protein [Dehalogenimonas alkenigignens]KTB47660.1 hypothetical protein DEALK_05050 [Dehalogenimonas alkenigignens]PVV84069.1 hypothetical protein DD509_05215 [Dehalogenimonas alkenigignens]
MKSWLKVVIPALLVVAVAAGCGGLSPALGEKFTLKAGQSAVIEGEDLKIRFDAVESDSRCPSDVVCVRAGEAVIRVTATQAGQNATLTMVEEGLTSGLNVVDYKNYHIEFRLTPYPVSTVELKQGDYRLELKITKS